MALRFVFDENLRGALWNLAARHNQKNELMIDVVRVGDAGVVPLGTKDPELLSWAERAGRVLVSSDRRTMARHLKDHLEAGHHSPGVMTLRPGAPLRVVLEFLVLASYATDPHDWADLNHFVPY